MKQLIDSLSYIQFDHSRWLNELVFSIKEIELYQDRLIEMIGETETLSEEDDLSNMFEDFEIQKKQAKELKLKIRKHMINNNRLVSGNGSLKKMMNSDHHKIRKQIEIFRKQYVMLKEAFHRFSVLPNFN